MYDTVLIRGAPLVEFRTSPGCRPCGEAGERACSSRSRQGIEQTVEDFSGKWLGG